MLIQYQKKYIQRLDSLGFLWQARVNDIYSFDITIRALQEFKTHYSDYDVPVLFEIPLEESWSADLWSLPLGTLVQNIRHGKSNISSHQYQQLREMGFLFKDVKKEIFMNDTLHALEIYREINGHCNVPNAFEIPSSLYDDNENESCRWPEKLKGLPLGSRVKAIRQRKLILDEEIITKFDELGFVFNVRKESNKKLLKACRLYIDLHVAKDGGKLPVEIPDNFKVRNDSYDWPTELWGYNIGAKLKYLKSAGTQRRLKDGNQTSIPPAQTTTEPESQKDDERWVMDNKWIQSELSASKRDVLVMELQNAGIKLF